MFTYLYYVIIKQMTLLYMYTLTEIILPIAFTALFIYWIGTVINLLITLLFNKENK